MTELRSAVRTVAAATLLGLALTGCGGNAGAGGSDPDPTGSGSASPTAKKTPDDTPDTSSEETPDSGKAPWGDGGTPAANGKRVGGPGSACADLPLTFTSARDWTSEAVDAGVFEQGGLAAVCEVDAKPAGALGYLRVFTGKSGASPREALAAYVKDQHPRAVTYRSARVGDGIGATEVSFVDRTVVDGEELDSKPGLAFAVPAGDGVAVVSLGGMDAEEHTEMLPAYLLAKKTLKVAAG